MFILTAAHYANAATIARSCRQIVGNIRRPAAIFGEKIVISIGIDESIRFYNKDWNQYTAIFSVGLDDRIDWFRGGDEFKPEDMSKAIENCLRLINTFDRDSAEQMFQHWCSIRCWKEHVMFDKKTEHPSS